MFYNRHRPNESVLTLWMQMGTWNENKIEHTKNKAKVTSAEQQKPKCATQDYGYGPLTTLNNPKIVFMNITGLGAEGRDPARTNF